MRWLISTDGTSRSHQAAQFAATLLRPGIDEAVLLGIVNRRNRATLDQSMNQIAGMLNGVVTRRVVRGGSVTEVIDSVASQETFDIALYASRGRRGLTRLLLGSVAARLAHEIPCSLLIVRKEPHPLKKVLIATTLSEDHPAPLEVGVEVASIASAELTILHVMSQITLEDVRYAGQLLLTAEQAIELATREGLGLERCLRIANTKGVRASPLIRRGLVEDEIVGETVQGNYDLVVLGAHGETLRSSWKNFLVEDVTNTVLMQTRCPVLVVRK